MDIVLRELQQENDEEDAFLANDYGGLGWELDHQVVAIREHDLKMKERFKSLIALEKPSSEQLGEKDEA